MIIIRADGGKGIGMGHLTRTNVLADELKKHTKVMYVCSKDYPEGIKFLKHKGYEVTETNCILETLLNSKAKCIITDRYAIDKKYIDNVRRHFKVVGYVDDNALMPYKADFILNQNFGAEEFSYDVSEGCKLLLGTDYLLVRKEFRDKETIQIREKAKKILLTVGGSDNCNLTGKLLEAVYEMPFDFHVVIGPIFPFQTELMNRYTKYNNIRFEVTPVISELAAECDIAISGCGSTLYELGLIGIPTMGIVVAANQIGLANRMGQAGMIKYLGDIEKIDTEFLRKEIETLANHRQERLRLQQGNKKILNANGAEKAAAVIIEKMEGLQK
jgi:UDP-2,4-diacetamido-2,4,6-trideoxy-beta-L-altropyranose hydrolase